MATRAAARVESSQSTHRGDKRRQEEAGGGRRRQARRAAKRHKCEHSLLAYPAQAMPERHAATGVAPSCSGQHIEMTITVVLSASHPWSKSKPRAEPEPVRRA